MSHPRRKCAKPGHLVRVKQTASHLNFLTIYKLPIPCHSQHFPTKSPSIDITAILEYRPTIKMSDKATNSSGAATEDVKGKGKATDTHDEMSMDEADHESESEEVSLAIGFTNLV